MIDYGYTTDCELDGDCNASVVAAASKTQNCLRSAEFYANLGNVLSDVLLAVDRGDFAALALLHLSAAFDTMDYNILLQRLQTSYGTNGSALQWFRSYLVGRTQRVRRGATISSAVHLVCGVTQGSVNGPILLVLYTADLNALVKSYGLSPHLYADDTQIYGSCSPSHVDMFLLLSLTVSTL